MSGKKKISAVSFEGERRGAARARRQNSPPGWASNPLRSHRRRDLYRLIAGEFKGRDKPGLLPHEVFSCREAPPSSAPPALYGAGAGLAWGGNSSELGVISSIVGRTETRALNILIVATCSTFHNHSQYRYIHQSKRMGYGMSRLEEEYCEPEGQSCDGSSSVQVNDEFAKLHNDIFHMTRIRSGLSESIYKSVGTNKGTISMARLLSGREVDCSGKGMFSSGDRAFVLGRYVPKNGPELLDTMDSRAYVSQFSADGTLFVAGFQGSHIRIYDVDRGWGIHKDIHARSLRWTISDVSLSHDQRYLVYSSLAPIIHIVNVGNAARESYANVTDIHDGLDFSQHEDVQYSFGIFSVKFSSDGRELVAGSNDDSIYVYDLHANKLTLRLPAHTSDVNTVAFADETGHLIYSGSDDNLCKVWDRRCLSTGEAAGVLTGHLHGVTHIDSRGDGRSFISNGKDQAIKLWDIRKMKSNADSYADGAPTWDYRYSRYPHQLKQLKHPHDQSLATYRGHSVLRTLIRCYFSPAYSTGQKYIYTGSYDSSVYIYDVVSGSQVAKLKGHQLAIRDCSWHPFDPTLVSSSWDGRVLKWTSTREQETSDVD